jgi:hypothetical protein
MKDPSCKCCQGWHLSFWSSPSCMMPIIIAQSLTKMFPCQFLEVQTSRNTNNARRFTSARDQVNNDRRSSLVIVFRHGRFLQSALCTKSAARRESTTDRPIAGAFPKCSGDSVFHMKQSFM